ncbi:DUF1266 domain-containing protein [Streptomyces sp. H27-D2]|uniref:DUF1266 domain-containing protein n=1 Tax=Streptomyces sp. H27-D2 TaxID=3046304 RepID=UPI002DBF707A|nr:DUF1266 domain-containing protein [Streptomyces sp. H27-D2]MEC4020369.1 DUF1266 domain-containing protein [Streptomyces sp. H27-D2]
MMGTTGWVPPTDTERLLHEATARGDWEAELAALSTTRLYLLLPRLHADTPGFTTPLTPRRDPATGKMCLPVLTPGMLPPWHPDWVFQQTTLAELADDWPHDKWWLAVNPGTACAATVEAKPLNREVWQEISAETGGLPQGRLVTHEGGPLRGPTAYGLACGAHLAVHNGVPWNQLGSAYRDYGQDIESLRRPWHITNRAEYQAKLHDLAARKHIDRDHEFALQARASLTRRLGQVPSAQQWEDTVGQALAVRDGHASEIEDAREAVRRIVRYEDRFRADGVLAADGRVESLAAFDLGRAVNVVRMGLGARYCDPREAEASVVHFGTLAQRAYGSWEAFSVAYALMRLIYFDEDSFGSWYQESLAQHRILTRDAMSPYRNIPWS